jgi:hypothetical protein
MTTPPTPHVLLNFFFFKYYKMALLLLFGMLLFLVFIAIIIFLILWNKNRMAKKKKEDELSELAKSLKEHQESMYNAATDLGIDPEDLKNELFESSNLVCYVYPTSGVCDTEFYDLKDGCCELRSNASELMKEARKEMAVNMATQVFMTMIPELILTEILPKLLKSAKGSAFLARVGGKGSALFSKIIAKSVAKASVKLAAKMALKAAAMATKLLIKLGSGPVGAALFMLDVLIAIQDYADVYNYNSFLDNEGNMGIRDKLVYEFAKALAIEGQEYPVLFPFSFIFEEESLIAITEYQSKVLLEHASILISDVPGGLEWYSDYILKILEAVELLEEGEEIPEMEQEEDQQTLEMFGTFYDKVREKHHLELDEFLFNTLQTLVPDNRKDDLLLIPNMSSTKSIGIGISEAAAEKWNKSQREEWFMYLDPFVPPNRPSAEWFPAMLASYTDTYLIPNRLNPGTSNAPNIVTRVLPQKVSLMYPFGMLTTFCEKKRTALSYQAGIDPTDFDVKLDPVTGVCDFTRAYCQRYGLDFKTKTWKDGTPYNDCNLSKDQEVVEFIIGQENTRQAKLWVTDPNQASTNMSLQILTTLQRRNEEHGPAVALLLTGIDPAGSFEGFGLNIDSQLSGRDKYCDPADTCKEVEVTHDGGNFMGWSARNKDGEIYSNGQGFQNQVKHGEKHSFFVPEGGSFRVKCDPGNSMNIQYKDIDAATGAHAEAVEVLKGLNTQKLTATDPSSLNGQITTAEANVAETAAALSETKASMKFSCWFGKVKKNPGESEFWDSAGDWFEEDAGPAIVSGLVTIGDGLADAGEDLGEATKDHFDEYGDDVEEDCGSGGNAKDCLETVFTFGWSDRRLKKDVKKTKLKSPISGLDVYTWEWNEIAMSTYGLKGSDFGFITDEIEDKYVSQDVYGYEYIMENTPVHKALLKLKSKYEVK